jgi:hypothetical protein
VASGLQGGVKRERRSFSPAQHQRQTQFRLIIGGLLILVAVGGGLIWAFYGRGAAITAVACLLGLVSILGLLWLILALLEKWVGEDES